ncbi:MAG: tetratricopeptide repeat protein, partial [Rhodobacteraceae bacterium]|nr:tetratricopeptide repeat protein [Paracoccaceae bacterium]
ESEIKKFIEKLLPLTDNNSDSGLDEAISAAEQMLEEKDFAGASEIFSAILGEDPVNSKAYAGLARAFLELGEIDKVEHLIENIPTELQGSKDIESIKMTLNLLAQSKGLASVEELTSLVKKNPEDKQAKLDLALVLIKESRISDAIDHLLELFRIDRDWNEGAAKSNLLIVFDTMKPDNPLVLKARRRLSSLIFS